MAKEQLTFTEFITLILTMLYDEELKGNYEEFIFLNELAKRIKLPFPKQWIFDAGKVLESRGYANCIFIEGGAVMATLTGEGRIFVENAIKEQNNIAREYKNNPSTYINISGGNVNITTGNKNIQTINIEEGKKELLQILEEIKEYIDKSNIDNKEDLQNDLESIKFQLNKKEPNKSIIADLLEPFGKIIGIAGKVATFIRMINV
jgi:hypothetical protein